MRKVFDDRRDEMHAVLADPEIVDQVITRCEAEIDTGSSESLEGVVEANAAQIALDGLCEIAKGNPSGEPIDPKRDDNISYAPLRGYDSEEEAKNFGPQRPDIVKYADRTKKYL